VRSMALINHKGGVGKTTATFNLAWAWADKNYKTMAIDLDPQGALSASMGHVNAEHGMDWYLKTDVPVRDIRINIGKNIWLIPPGSLLSDIKVSWGAHQARYSQRLHQLIVEAQESGMDFVVFDCPPADLWVIELLVGTVGALLIPVTPDYLALQGLSMLMKKLAEENDEKGPEVYVFLTRYQARKRIAQEAEQMLKQHFGSHLLEAKIREAVAVAESPGFGQSIFQYASRHPAAMDYLDLAGEIISRLTLQSNYSATYAGKQT